MFSFFFKWGIICIQWSTQHIIQWIFTYMYAYVKNQKGREHFQSSKKLPRAPPVISPQIYQDSELYNQGLVLPGNLQFVSFVSTFFAHVLCLQGLSMLLKVALVCSFCLLFFFHWCIGFYYMSRLSPYIHTSHPIYLSILYNFSRYCQMVFWRGYMNFILLSAISFFSISIQ